MEGEVSTAGHEGLGSTWLRRLTERAIQQLAARLRTHGVEVSGVIETGEGNYLTFEDPDGNPIYVGDWDYTEESARRETAQSVTS